MAASDPRIPDKQYFRIGEVAEIAQVESYVLRFWETEFSALRPQKTRTGHRTYSRRDVVLVLRIRDLLYEEGYTIPGARKQLKRQAGEKPTATPPRTRATLAKIRQEVEGLLQLFEE